MKKSAYKIPAIVALIISVSVFLSSISAFASVSPDFLSVDSIEIIDRHGIVEGASFTLSAEIMPENTIESAVKWSSSNPSVISCTENGIITGVSAGGYADIKCEAKFGSESDKIRVYCVESVGTSFKTGFVDYFTFIYGEPGTSIPIAWNLNYMSLITDFLRIVAPALSLLINAPVVSDANEFTIFSSKCEVKGRYGSYAYVTFDNGNGEKDGFVKYSKLKTTSNEFLSISTKNMDVWGNGYVNVEKKLTSDYKGEVKWTVGDLEIVSYNEKTGQVIGLKPGTTTITATVGDMNETCTVYSLYRWPQTWKTKTNCDTNLYTANKSEYVSVNYMLKGTVFEVYGDNGTSDGWAYGCATINGVSKWGYVPIDRVSVKGTISQYRNLKTTLNGVRIPWLWPVRDTKNGVAQSSSATFVSSPYGWRSLEGKGSDMHKGIDITTGTPGEIKGYDIVSTCAGKVVYVGNDKNSGYGYCLSVRSDEKDPVTGLYYVVTYMHLNSLPIVRTNDYVTANQVLGYVGNTSSDPDMGYHLHFEINSKNSTLNDGSGTRNSYDNLINPIFIFVDKCVIGTASDKKTGKIVIDQTSDAVSKYRGAYWYGDNTGKENNQ